MRNLRSLNKYFIKYRWRLILGVIFIICANIFGVYSPQVVRQAVNTIVSQISYYRFYENGTSTADYFRTFSTSILFFAILVVALAIVRGLFMFFMRQTIIVMSRLIEFDQKNEIYKHYQELHLDFYKRNNTGDLMSRITEDVSRARMYTGPAMMYTINLIVLFVMVIFTMIRVNPELTLYTVAPLPVLGFTIFYVNGIIEKKSELIQKQLAFLTTISQESYSGIRVIKSYVQERYMYQYFENEAEQYKARTLDLARTEAIYFPVIFLLVGLSTLSTIFIGGRQVMEGKITPGNIAEFVIYINMLTWPMASVGWVMALVQRASASQKRIDEFLSTPSAIVSPAAAPEEIHGEIEFRHVSFTYPNTGITALRDVSFHLKKGERLAVIGRTGAGKSTLAQMLIRLYDPDEGQVLIDGKKVQAFNLDSLRKQIGYVPQDVFLFSDTISRNIAFGLDQEQVSAQRVREAARQASVLNEIELLPQKFDTLVGERGVTLSGGQKQRISIARALIKEPRLMIFDDCLSAVDAQTEQNILGYLNQVLASKTAIIITHRIFSLLTFDKIIVLDEGRVAEEGTHESLLAKGGLYAELFSRQQLEDQARSEDGGKPEILN
jgi:ATP-binding cassette subfamily B protein